MKLLALLSIAACTHLSQQAPSVQSEEALPPHRAVRPVDDQARSTPKEAKSSGSAKAAVERPRTPLEKSAGTTATSFAEDFGGVAMERCLLPPTIFKSRLHLVQGGRLRLDRKHSILGVDVRRNGSDLDTQLHFHEQPGLQHFQATSFAMLGQATLVVSGVDRTTCEAVLVQVELDFSGSAPLSCVEIYRGTDVRTPLSAVHIPGTRALHFIDYGNSRVVEYNLRNDKWATVFTFPPLTDYRNYLELSHSSVRGDQGQWITAYVLTKLPWARVPGPPSAYAVDNDGDGLFETKYF